MDSIPETEDAEEQSNRFLQTAVMSLCEESSELGVRRVNTHALVLHVQVALIKTCHSAARIVL